MSSYLSEYRAERRADQAAAAERQRAARAQEAQIRIARETAAANARRLDKAADNQARAARRAEARAARATWRASLPGRLLDAGWAWLIILPMLLAWAAQAQFAADFLHLDGALRHAFPASIELAAWITVFEARKRTRAGESAGSLPRWTWVLAGIAAAINAAHGTQSDGIVAGVALGTLSLLGVLLHSIRHGLDAAAATGPAYRGFGLMLWRRLRYPRLSLAAASLRAARELDQVTAWRLAWEERYGIGPDATRRDRRLARVVVARQAKDDRKAARAGELQVIGGRVVRDMAPAVREFIDQERAAARELVDAEREAAQAVIHGAQDVLTAAGLVFGPDALAAQSETLPAGRALSPRATELLPELRAAIEAGDLAPNPSVNAIRTWIRTARGETCGVPVAQELRDTVKNLHLVPAVDDAVDAVDEVDSRVEAAS